ncbi:hypothetical protein BVRB_8g185600 [Beta vulgaris subsp. vulgaris]|nr:hypothetical protein BVRB_8g185600 [Beta vulgaris subsp. vulgaris]
MFSRCSFLPLSVLAGIRPPPPPFLPFSMLFLSHFSLSSASITHPPQPMCSLASHHPR